MDEFKEKIVKEEVDRLNNALRKLDSVNVIDSKSLITRKQNQKRLNEAYSLVVDVKMNLNKLLEVNANE